MAKGANIKPTKDSSGIRCSSSEKEDSLFPEQHDRLLDTEVPKTVSTL